ncbi:MAG: homocysteine S-methyltransferase family protein [Oscillospiraceae bacterium]|jgi:5-methyltetrahydrofolate--homocysteine methyltransferase|nr:homocysteine S-methyltransferase family protein [Oscillospiraceae bacterium]
MFNGFHNGNILLYDGALGTMLQSRGLPAGRRPDVMNMLAPDAVEDVHRMYVDAGSDIICTNTFGSNATALSSEGYDVSAVVGAAVAIARRAAAGRASVALDVGPTGGFLEPYGDLTFDDMYGAFAEQARAGAAAGADIIAIETMSEPGELRAAILAARENTPLPVFATMTFNADGRTYTGCTPENFAAIAAELGAAAIGINCSLAPEVIFPIAERLAAASDAPLIIKPNAGLPDPVTGEYYVGPDEFARQMERFKELNVRVVGGCCGTTPDYIRALRLVFGERTA